MQDGTLAVPGHMQGTYWRCDRIVLPSAGLIMGVYHDALLAKPMPQPHEMGAWGLFGGRTVLSLKEAQLARPLAPRHSPEEATLSQQALLDWMGRPYVKAVRDEAVFLSAAIPRRTIRVVEGVEVDWDPKLFEAPPEIVEEWDVFRTHG